MLRTTKTLLLLLTIIQATIAIPHHQFNTHRRNLHETVCRGEETCLKQVCNPAAYQYDISTAGLDFPYSVTYTTTGSDTTTSFVFNVCNTPAAHDGCTPSAPGCAPLKAVLLRIRDDALETGHGITADPAGTMWSSCSPYGPGHLWDASFLGALATSRARNATCTALTVTMVGKGAKLSDVCQQGIVIKDNKNTTIFDQSTLPESCLFVLEEQNGRLGYGTVVDPRAVATVQPTALATESVSSIVSQSKGPQAYGRRRLRGQRAHRYTMPQRLF